MGFNFLKFRHNFHGTHFVCDGRIAGLENMSKYFYSKIVRRAREPGVLPSE
jgi:hypothetical protein